MWQFFGYLGADWPTCMLCSFIAAALFFTVFVAPILAELVTEWSAAKPFLHDVELLNHSDKRYRKFQERTWLTWGCWRIYVTSGGS